MNELHTLRQHERALSVRTLSVEVCAGPDRGLRAEAESELLNVGSAEGNELVLQDRAVSRYHLSLRCVPQGIEVVDHDSTNGSFVGNVRLGRAVLPPGSVLTLGQTQLRVGEGHEVGIELHEGERLGSLLGRSPLMRRLMAQVEKAARSDAPVLISGESGTGKELVAEALHTLSPRGQRPFVTVDCGALTATLVASELFGHERGAFTGADRQHQGAFERAHGGTLFLDEVGELAPALQASLLGVLQRKRFRRLGGKEELSVDVRVLCATHRDLRNEVNTGAFRLDLYYRLAVIALSVPALRERREDVALLAAHFLREAGHEGPISELISDSAMQQLAQHRFPGNVRELRNVIEATLAMGEPPTHTLDGQPATPADPIAGLLDRTYKDARGVLLNDFERRYLTHWLAKTAGNVSRAAREARIDRSHLNDLLQRHRLR